MARWNRSKHLPDPETVASGAVSVGIEVLFRLIHEVNPTERGLPPGEETRRYALKARLQSCLIRAHGAALVAEGNPDEDAVIGLRHVSGTRDACHTVVAALDDDARLWLRRQVVAPADDPAPRATPIPAAAPRSSSPFAAGIEALDAYDYEGAESCFEEALRSGNERLAAARALLELHVDHLAQDAEALALDTRLPREVRADPAVRILLAKALARQHQPAEAASRLAGLGGEEAANAWALVARALLRRGDLPGAERAREALREADPAHPGFLAVGDAIATARAGARAPLEAGLEALAAEGRWEEVATEAARLLRDWPGSTVARALLARAERLRVEAEAARCCAEAERLEQAGDLEAALVRWTRAREMTPEHPDLASRAEALRAALAQRANQAAAAGVEAAWARSPEEGRRAWLEAEPEVRSLALLPDPELAALVQLAGAVSPSRREALVQAVGALSALRGAWPADDPEPFLVLLEPHRALLARLGWVREAERDALRRREALARARAEATLIDLEARLRAGDLLAARTALGSLAPPHLPPEAAPHLETLRLDLERREREAAFLARFRAAREAHDLLAARRVAREALAAGVEDAWDERLAAVEADVIAAWGPVVLPGSYAWTDLRDKLAVNFAEGCAWLAPEGRIAIVVDILDRYVVLREVALHGGQVERLVLLRLPQAPGEGAVRVLGDRVLIFNERLFLAIGRHPWRLLDWRPLDEFAGPTGHIESVCPSPDGRLLWIAVQAGRGGRTLVVDTEGWRVQRTLPGAGSLRCCASPEHRSIVRLGPADMVTTFSPDGGRTFMRMAIERAFDAAAAPSGDGAVILGSAPMEAERGTAHPLVLIRWTRGSDDTPGIPMKGFPPRPEARVFASTRHALAYVLARPAKEGAPVLTAVRLSERSHGPVWSTSVPRASFPLTRADGAECALFCLGPEGVVLVPLDGDNPEARLPGAWFRGEFPNFDDVRQELEYGGAAQALTQALLDAPDGPVMDDAARRASLEGQPWLLGLLALGRLRDDGPAAARALLGELALATTPDLGLARAAIAFEERDWASCVAALQTTPGVLPEPRFHPLRAALGSFAWLHLGDPERSRAAWAGVHERDQSRGHLDYLEELCQVPDEGRVQRAHLVVQHLRALRAADAHLAQQDPRGAAEILDVVPLWVMRDLQAHARLVRSRLDLADPEPMEIYRGMITLAVFLALRGEEHLLAHDLLLGPATWDEDRMAALEGEAREGAERCWEGLVGEEG